MTVNSLSYQAFAWTMSTNFLNPSRCALRKIEQPADTLAENLVGEVDLYDRTIVPHSQMGDILRGIARMLVTLAIQTFVAPVGILYNGAQSLRYLNAQDPEGITKFKAHFKGLCADAWMASTPAYILGSIWAYLRNLKTTSHALGALGACYTPIGISIVAALSPRSCLLALSTGTQASRETIPAYTAFMLREDYGLVGEQDELLRFHPEWDLEGQQPKFLLEELLETEAATILRNVQIAQKRLGIVIAPANWLKPHEIISYLKQNKAEIQARLRERNMPIEIWDQTLAKFEKHAENIQQYQNNMLEIHRLLLPWVQQQGIELPQIRISLSPEEADGIMQQSPVDDILDRDLPALSYRPSTHAEYQRIRTQLQERDVWAALSISGEPSQGELHASRKHLQGLLHPDKAYLIADVPPQEIEALFKCATAILDSYVEDLEPENPAPAEAPEEVTPPPTPPPTEFAAEGVGAEGVD